IIAPVHLSRGGLKNNASGNCRDEKDSKPLQPTTQKPPTSLLASPCMVTVLSMSCYSSLSTMRCIEDIINTVFIRRHFIESFKTTSSTGQYENQTQFDAAVGAAQNPLRSARIFGRDA